ncbi:L-aspartate oxidase [Labeo rohita]|uniref:L-aspartate oxidase n=1 Tax=Labeo rohita TaxID=84645 RepID=A0ABQ8L852_LABRO|nr:L-aspartate oxidase [Labeo rohita]
MERGRSLYFSAEEQTIIMQKYNEFKHVLQARSNTVSAAKAREDCWRKIADSVNATLYHKRFLAANRKKCDGRKTGGGPPPPEYTVAEELALSNSEGRPIMDGISGARQSDPGAGSSKQVTVVDGNTVALLKPSHIHAVSQTESVTNEETLSACSETEGTGLAEDFSQPTAEPEASTSMGFKRNVNKPHNQ